MNEFHDNPILPEDEPIITPAPEIPEPVSTPAPEIPEPVSTPAPEIPEPVSTPVVPKPVPPRKRGGKGIVAIILCCCILGSLLGTGGVLLVQHLTENDHFTGSGQTSTAPTGDSKKDPFQNMDPAGKDTQPGADNNVAPPDPDGDHNVDVGFNEIDGERLLTAAEVYAANVNSTVGITTSITTNYWGYQSTSAASGSGFIYTEDGYILTNYHVIEDSDSITVSLFSGEEYAATLIGYDESNDIAVLKIEATNLTPVTIGDSDKLNVGDDVLAIGNPLGELTFSLTGGMISAKDREVTFSNNVTMRLLQTDCAINSGNSGGPLFNMYGEVVGVTNAKYSSSGSSASIDNIGFAIPINTVKPIVDSIIEKGYMSKPYIGITVSDVSQSAQMYGIPAGAAIQSVVEGGAAEKAGLQAGDVVTAANGQTISSASDLVNAITVSEIGSKLELTVYRQGKTLTISVTVEEKIQTMP